jgi:hypothetical protein
MMVAVAVVAILMSGIVMKQRRDEFVRRASFASDKRRDLNNILKSNASLLPFYMKRIVASNEIDAANPARLGEAPASPDENIVRAIREQAEWGRKHLLWYDRQVLKYRRAARYPWLPVAPDPPEPK